MGLKGRLVRGAAAVALAALLLIGVLLALPAGAREARPRRSSASARPLIVINEVAWGGTAANAYHEWIELYNPGEAAVDLGGWTLVALDGEPDIILSGVLQPHETFLLEQGLDDRPISDIPSDQDYVGILENGGEQLELRDGAGVPVDSANRDGGDWPAGTASLTCYSMERIDPYAADSDENWAPNDGLIRNGEDDDGDPINGTPKAWNSAGVTADLGLRKSGPAVVWPGDEITYTLTVSNSGALTATAVTLTDTLPAGVIYLDTAAPYPLSRPDDRTLVWELGTLPANSGSTSFSFTGQLTAPLLGAITNTLRVRTEAIERQLEDNWAEWGSWVDSSTYYADLVVRKSGPTHVAAGAAISYTLSLSNSGGLTATRVVLTDAFPSGATFTFQDSPYTFTRPASGTLVWDVNSLNAYSSPVSWTVAGAVIDGLTGPLTNTVVVTSAAPEAEPADNLASVTTAATYTPTVRLTAVHFDAVQGGDEAVRIANLGNAPAEIGEWELTDGESVAVIPPNVTLAAGESVWLAKDAVDFRMQFGHAPDFEKGGSDPTVPDLSGGWPALALDGDEVVLTDDGGVVQDVLVYKEGNTYRDGWDGPALYPYHPGALSQAGQILYRKLDQASGRPVPDSDTAADWAQETADPVNGRKVLYPGWDLDIYFQTARITQTAHLTVAVGPDALFPALVAEINRATRSLQIQSYTFENTALAQAVAARAVAGVSVTVLLDGSPAGGLSDQERWVCQEIEAAGGRCYFTIDDDSRDIVERYAHQHAKYLIVDGELALVGSENLGMVSMPYDDLTNGTAGRRGVYLITDAPGVVAHLVALFARDMDPANHQDIAAADFIGLPPEGYVPITATDWTSYTPHYTVPLSLDGTFAFEIVQSPENSLRDTDALLGLLAWAGEGDTVLVQQMDEPLYWGAGESNPADDPNLRLEAYVAAARRGAGVRILLDGYFPDPPTDPRGNWATCAYLRALATAEGLRLACQQNNPTYLGIHNKMVLVQIDGRGYLHVGSINGTELSSKGNREVALQVGSDEAYAYLAAVFERDWRHEVYLPIVFKGYGPADHPLISEVLYDPEGTDGDREWVELYNPTERPISLAGWMLGDAVAPADSEGMYLFPGAVLSPQQVMLIALRGTLFFDEYGYFPDYELVETSAAVPNLLRHPDWGAGYLALANYGDELLLLDPAGKTVDVVVWGNGSFPGVTPHPGVELDGSSLERVPPWLDGDDCSRDFQDQLDPNPGVLP